jgi:hypothetical protein
VPQSSWSRIGRLAFRGERASFETCADYEDDYLGQQITKLSADTLTDAEIICHVDSDCIFVRPMSPADLLFDGKVRVLMQPNDQLGRHRPWQGPTEAFLGWTVPYDFMCQPPFAFPRWLYADVRNHAIDLHNVTLESYVRSRPPRGFSEFNVLGGFAHRRHHDCFSWVDASVDDSGKPFCRWYWSWDRVDPATRSDLEALLSA